MWDRRQGCLHVCSYDILISVSLQPPETERTCFNSKFYLDVIILWHTWLLLMGVLRDSCCSFNQIKIWKFVFPCPARYNYIWLALLMLRCTRYFSRIKYISYLDLIWSLQAPVPPQESQGQDRPAACSNKQRRPNLRGRGGASWSTGGKQGLRQSHYTDKWIKRGHMKIVCIEVCMPVKKKT